MPVQKIVKSRKSPVLLRKRIPSTSEVSDAFVETEGAADRQNFRRPLPDWMQPVQYPISLSPVAMRSRPAQSPPEVAPAFVVPVSAVATDEPVVYEDLRQFMGGENVPVENEWETVPTKRFSKRARQLDQTSREISDQVAQRVVPAVFSPLPYVMPSSTSPVSSEKSDSSEPPTYFQVVTFSTAVPVIPSLQPVVSKNQLPSTEPASIAERILSSEGRMSSAQRECVASATRLARMMSPAQLSARSELVGAEILNFSRRIFDQTEFSVPITSIPSDVPSQRTFPKLKKTKRNKRARLTITVPTLPALAEVPASASMTSSSLPTSVEMPGMIAPENVTTASVHFNPYYDRVMPELKYPYTRAMV